MLMRTTYLLAPAALILAATGCSLVAIARAPEKEARVSNNAATVRAKRAFRSALADGRYDALPAVLHDLTAAYLENPHDAETAGNLAFAHMWRVTESARLDELPPTITDHLVLARKYFAEASRLAPSDARLQGFHGSVQLAEGTVHDDEKLVRKGYFELMDSIRAWPEFNLFTAGYTLSRLPHYDAKFEEALEYQWKTLERCSGTKIDRDDPDYSYALGRETLEGAERACWNSPGVPHNFEGFFLNMGDMLVKAGSPETARTIYANARLSRTYDTWPYREVLEERIRNADANVLTFRYPTAGAKTETVMVTSSFACVACHQR
jgi:hypothetical protein